MTTATVNTLFYDLTKEEMKALCPERFRVVIRKAFDNMRSGMGPGPTMADVIEHYEDEQTYRCIRGINAKELITEILDTFFEFGSGMEGYTPWFLPTMVDGSERMWPVGRFKFAGAKRSFPQMLELLQAEGWYR